MTLIASRGTIAARAMWAVYQAQGHTVSATFRTVGAASVDYTTGALTQATTDTLVNGLLVGYRNREVDGVRVLAGDQRLFCLTADLDALPTLRDRAVLDGDTWAIVDISDTASGAIMVLQLRRIGDVDA